MRLLKIYFFLAAIACLSNSFAQPLSIGVVSSSSGIRQAILGTLGDPNAGNSTVNTNTWFSPQSLPYASTLRQVKFYCATSGNVTLKIAQPIKGGSWNIVNEQVLACVTGLNTFSVAAGTLTRVSVPANSLIGFRTASSGIVAFNNASTSGGYMGSSANLTGNNVEFNLAPNYTSELQFQFTLEYRRGTNPNYIIDEDFAGTKLPAYCSNRGTTWTFTAGKAVPGATGLGNGLLWYHRLTANNITAQAEFIFKASGDRFAIFRTGNSGGQGVVGEVDLNQNKIILRNQYDGTSTLPAVTTSLVLTAPNLSPLAVDTRYRIELIRNGNYLSNITLRITNVSTGVSEPLSTTNDGTTQCIGTAGVASLNGTTTELKDFKIFAARPNPAITIYGNSIENGAFATVGNGWSQLLQNNVTNNNLWSSGQHGATSLEALKNLRGELSVAIPVYVIISIGINDAAQSTGVTDYQTSIQNIYTLITNYGSIPIICYVTPSTVSAQNTRVQSINSYLTSQTSWRKISFHIAMTLNNDGVTVDPSLLSDTVHPTTAGHLTMYNRVVTDAPFLFLMSFMCLIFKVSNRRTYKI